MWRRNNRRQQRNVLIVSVLLPITIDIALRSNTQRRVVVLRVCQVPISKGWLLLKLMREAEVETQAPADSLVSKIVPYLHVAAPLASAGRDAELRADLRSSRAEDRAKHGDHAVLRQGCT